MITIHLCAASGTHRPMDLPTPVPASEPGRFSVIAVPVWETIQAIHPVLEEKVA